MSLEAALRWTEILMGLAFIQQSAEHLLGPRVEKIMFSLRIIASVLLVLGIQSEWMLLALVLLGLAALNRFQGPYNGGSDRMSLLILCCVCLGRFMPNEHWQELAFGYLAMQLMLSYFISGQVKIVNPEWRNGRALRDVFQFSAYPVSEGLRELANWPRLLWAMSWAVILFELLFPLSIFSQKTLLLGLVIAGTFHLSNACLFGLNRFFWIWLAAYPSILWLQDRTFSSG